ncbi:MAG: hypothetical protein NCW75_11050 [Phycisphaera sp.]|nr:MAG: hypothetical protein NCW75_11050 [Phycisphaera sp.]
MPRPAKRRSTPARLALIAWLAFALMASMGPFLVDADLTVIGNRSGFDTVDVVIGGGAIDVRSGSWRSVISAVFDPYLTWHPSASDWIAFELSQVMAYQTVHYWGVKFPPWAILLVPTLLALTTHHFLRHRAHRKLNELGRTPCPTCNYDATDLTTCPECGGTLTSHTETQT